MQLKTYCAARECFFTRRMKTVNPDYCVHKARCTHNLTAQGVILED